MTRNSHHRTRTVLSLLALVAALSGCVSQTPVVNRHFGEAALAARAQQTANPQAAQAAAAPVGLDGRSGKNALDRYYDSFRQPPQTSNVMNIGVAGGD